MIVCRPAALLPLFLTFAPCGRSQSVVLRSSDTAVIDVTSVRTYAGAVPAQARALSEAGAIVVAIVTPLAPAAFDELSTELRRVYAAHRNTLRVAVLTPGGFAVAGPFARAAQFASAVEELKTQAAAITVPAGSAELYSSIVPAIERCTGDCSAVVLAGALPDLNAATAPYATAYVSTHLLARHVRLSYWLPGGAPAPGFLDTAARLTGGGPGIEPASGHLTEVTWAAPAPKRGFIQYEAELLPQHTKAPAAAGAPLPDLVAYALLQENIKTIERIASLEHPSAADAAELPRALQAALDVSPRDERALDVGARAYARFNNHDSAAQMLSRLMESRPGDAQLGAREGHELFLAKKFDDAEAALNAARGHGAGSPGVSADLARILVARRDYRHALPLLDEALKANGNDQELWFTRADACAYIKDWDGEAKSLEHALSLGGAHLERRAALANAYIDHGDTAAALRTAEAALPLVPANADARAMWAGVFTRLNQPKRALALWRSVLALDPAREPAHFAVAQILIASKDTRALDVIRAGLAAAPQSVRLHLLEARMLESSGRVYEARRALRGPAITLRDAALLEHYATLEDTFGGDAADAYAHELELLLGKAGQRRQIIEVARRGLLVSLRDGNGERASWFRMRLRELGETTGGAAPAAPRDENSGVWVPGGLDALAYVTRAKTGLSSEEFLTGYCRALLMNVQNAKMNKKGVEAYLNGIHDYFERLRVLTASARQSEGGKAVVTLAWTDKNEQQRTRKLLDTLGWKIRGNKGEIVIEAGEKGKDAGKQDLAAGLAIDMVGMQKAFQAGKPFRIEIPYEWAAIPLGEKAWTAEFYPDEKFAGGLFEAAARNPRVAQLANGISMVDGETARQLLRAAPMHVLADKYGVMLSAFGSALAVAKGHVVVPGGVAAEPLWAKLAGADPAEPPQFLRALLGKQDGKLLAWFYVLSELDAPHQRFFTLNGARLTRFYELYRDSAEATRSTQIRDSSFSDFLRSIPLDDTLHVEFPGSPEVWMVVKGRSANAQKTAKMLRKAHKKAAPDVEDDILVRLASTRYKSLAEHRSELDNFLAVVRIEEHRDTALDEESAIELSQRYSDYGALYPYFAVFTGLEQRDFARCFGLLDKLRANPKAQLNDELGQFYSLLELLRLGVESGRIGEEQSTEVFYKICDDLARAGGEDEFTIAALDVARTLAGRSGDADAGLRALILGNDAGWRARDFSRVLQLQKVPPLQPVLELIDAGSALANGKGAPAANIKALDAAAALIPEVSAEKNAKLRTEEKRVMALYSTARLREAVAQFDKNVARKKLKTADFAKPYSSLMAALFPQVRLALSGLVYARYLRTSDLLVSDDALFLRKHAFAAMHSSDPFVVATSVQMTSDDAGSYLTGSFANMAAVAGRVAVVGSKVNGADALAMQIGALRATNWTEYDNTVQRLAALRILIAREWFARAASDKKEFDALAEETLGVLSLGRRRALLDGIRDGDWRSVWEAAPLADLYFIGDRFLARYPAADPWPSPVASELRKFDASPEAARVNLLGPAYAAVLGCSEPHLAAPAPYEEYERYMFPALAGERASFFKLYLADLLDRSGQDASLAGPLAESTLKKTFQSATLLDPRDWRGILAAFEKMNAGSLDTAVAQAR